MNSPEIKVIDDTIDADPKLGVTISVRFQSAMESLMDPFVLLCAVRDAAGTPEDFILVAANKAFSDAVQIPADILVGSKLLEISPHHRGSEEFRMLTQALATGTPFILKDYEYSIPICGPGRDLYVTIHCTPLDAEILAVTARDVTEEHLAHITLSESERLYRTIANDIADAIIRVDTDFTITWVSPSFETLTGTSDAVGANLTDIMFAEDQNQGPWLREYLTDHGVIEGYRFRIARKEGDFRWVSMIAHPFNRTGEGDEGYIAVIRDLQNEVDAQNALAHQSAHDSLTGLPKKDPFLRVIDEALTACLGDDTCSVALLTVGVDQLRRINEGLTYLAGDEVLRAVAERIATTAGRNQTGRVAGDEFSVIIPKLRNKDEAEILSAQICDSVRKPLTLSDGRTLTPTVSIGIALSKGGVTPEELLRHSTLAMRRAKQEGRDRWSFADQQTGSRAARFLDVEEGIRQGLINGEFVPWYQPVVRLSDRSIVGYEALARWVKPDGSVVPPGDFIPVAESGKLIIDIDKHVLIEAMKRLRDLPDAHMAANISVVTLASPGFLQWLETFIEDNHDIASRMRLEVTETALLEVSDEILAKMRHIESFGAQWYADDFGVGYSSISYLRDLPIGGLKLDMSFTRGLREGDQQAIRLAQGLAGLAHGLGMETVAEGVESEIQAILLQGQGWEMAQGWYFGKASPIPLISRNGQKHYQP